MSVSHSPTSLPSKIFIDLYQIQPKVFSSELKIPNVLIPSLHGNCTKPSYFLPVSIFSFLNTVYTKLHRAKDKEGCMMDLYKSIMMFPGLFAVPFPTLAFSSLFVMKYWRGFNVIPSQCFLKIGSSNVLLESETFSSLQLSF